MNAGGSPAPHIGISILVDKGWFRRKRGEGHSRENQTELCSRRGKEEGKKGGGVSRKDGKVGMKVWGWGGCFLVAWERGRTRVRYKRCDLGGTGVRGYF